MPTQHYLYPWGADGEAEVVQWDERFGSSLQTTQTGIKTIQDTQTYTSKDIIGDGVRTQTKSLACRADSRRPVGSVSRMHEGTKGAKGTDISKQIKKKKICGTHSKDSSTFDTTLIINIFFFCSFELPGALNS